MTKAEMKAFAAELNIPFSVVEGFIIFIGATVKDSAEAHKKFFAENDYGYFIPLFKKAIVDEVNRKIENDPSLRIHMTAKERKFFYGE